MGGVFDFDYRLEETCGGTRFRHTNDVRWLGLMRIMHPMMKRVTKRGMDRQLGLLKEVLE